VAALQSHPERQRRVGRMGSIGGSRSGSGKPWRLVRRVWKGSLAPRIVSARAGQVRGVTGGVCGQVVRPASWPNTPRVGFRPPVGWPPTGTNGRKPQLAVVAPTTSLLEVGDAVRGYSAPPWKGSLRRQHEGVGERVGTEAEASKRKPRARELVDSAGARDNKSVADADERHLPSGGLTAFRRGRHEGG
jgi:hypothetical protein